MRRVIRSSLWRFVLLGMVACIALLSGRAALAQTGSQIANNQVDKFESWDRDKNPSADWTTGQNDSYMESETVPT